MLGNAAIAAAEALEARFFEGPDEARIDLATLALETAAARDAKNAKRSAAMDSDSDEDWNQGGGWAGLG